MTKRKDGFTLIEVSLFLAITGLLFLGVTIGVQNSIFQQRYNDSVQNFVEFLTSAYSKIENVQGDTSGGTSDQVIYGKLITFGQAKNLNGTDRNDDKVFMYDVIGDIKCKSDVFAGTLATLEDCGADVLETKDGKKTFLGLAESYSSRWSAVIQGTTSTSEPFKGTLLITRHPQTGTISTYTMNDVIQVNEGVGLKDYLTNHSFKSDEAVDFCINPNGNNQSNIRADVRLKANARNASAIEVMPDSENNCASRG